MSRSGRRSEDWWEDDAPSEPEGWWGAGGDIHERINQFTSPPSNPPTGLNLIVEAARNPGVHTPFDPTFSNPSPLQPLGPGVPYRHTPGTPYPSFDRPVTSQPIVPATPPTPSIPLLPAPGQTSWVDQSIAPHLPGITNFDFSTGRWRDSQGRFVSAAQAPGMNIAQSHTAQSSAVTPYTPVPYWTQMNPPQPFQPVEPTRTQGLPIIPNVPFQPYTPNVPTSIPGQFPNLRAEPATWTQSGGFLYSRNFDEQGRLGGYGPDVSGQQQSRSHFISYNQITPQIAVMSQSQVTIPQQRDSRGNIRDPYWNETFGAIQAANEQRGVSDYVWWGGSHIFRAGPVLQSMMPTTPEGTIIGDITNKLPRRGGLHETWQFGKAPGVPMPMATSPFSFSVTEGGHTSPVPPMQGYVFQGAFSRYNVLTGEGQGAVPHSLGYGINERVITAPIPEGGFEFGVGDVFAHRPGFEPVNFMEGDVWRGYSREIPGLPGTGQSAPFTRVSGIAPSGREGFANITLGEAVPPSMLSGKTGKKYNWTTFDDSFFTGDFEGVQFVGVRPDLKKYPDFVWNVLAGEYADRPNELRSRLGLPESGVITPDISRQVARQAYSLFEETYANAERLRTREVRIDEQQRRAFEGVQFEFGGQQHSVLSNIRAAQDLPGSYMATYTDTFAHLKFMERPRAELARPVSTIKGEELDRMRLNQPELYTSISNRIQAGAIQRPALDLAMAVSANRNPEQRQKLNIINADDINYEAIRQSVLGDTPGLSAEQADVETLRRLGQQTRGQHIQIGDRIFAPASVAASHIVYDREGKPIQRTKEGEAAFPMAMSTALKANENLRQLAQVNLPEDITGAVSERNQAVEAAFASMQTLYGHESTYERAYGVDMNVLAGPAQAMAGLPGNTAVIKRQQLYQMMGANTKEAREQAMEAYRSGNVQIAASMYPHADPNRGWAVLNIMLEEDVRRLPGMSHVRVGEGNFGMSGMLAQWFEKDYDADYARAILTQQFHEGKMVGNSVAPMTNEQIVRMIGTGYAKEFEAIREKAVRGNEEYWQRAEQGFFKETAVDDFVTRMHQRGEMKPEIGKQYNTFNREMYTLGNIVGLRAMEEGMDVSHARAAKEALGGLAKFAYQPHLDEEAWARGEMGKTTFGEWYDTMRMVSQDSSKMPGQRQGYLAGEKSKAIAEISSPEGAGRFAAERWSQIGFEYAKENLEGYRKDVLPHVAALAVGQEFAANSEQVQQMMQVIDRHRETGVFDPEAFLKASGQKHGFTEWMAGNRRTGIRTASVAGLLAGTAMGSRSMDSSAGYKYEGGQNLPGFTGKMANVLQGIRGLFGSKTSPHSIDERLAQSENLRQLQEVFGHTTDIDEMLGGTPPAPQEALPEVQALTTEAEQIVPEAVLPSKAMANREGLARRATQRRAEWLRETQDPELRETHQRILDRNRSAIRRYHSKYESLKQQERSGGLGNISGGGGPVDPPDIGMPENMPERPTGGGTSIGTQNIFQSDFKIGPKSVAVTDPGTLQIVMDRFQKFGEEIERVTKQTTEYTKAQEALVKWTKSAGNEFESIVKAVEHNKDLAAKGNYFLSPEEDQIRMAMEQPGFNRIREQIKELTSEAGSQLEAREFAQIFREGARTPQPSRDELWDVLGQRGRGAAKKRQEWIDAKFFEEGGIPTEGISGAIVGAAARTRSLFTDESGQAISGLLWRSSMVAGIGLIPQLRAGMDYQNALAERGMNLFTGGMAGYDDLMSGSYGRIMRGAAGRGASQLAFGQQVYNAYGSFYETSFPGIMQGPVGAAAGVLGPAAAIGTIASMSPLGPAGWAIGAGVAAIGAVGYASSASQDRHAQGRYMDLLRSQGPIGAAFGDFSGFTGSAVNAFGDFIAGTPGGESSVYRTDQFYQIAERYSRGEISLGRVREAAKQYGIPDAEALGIVQQQYETSGLDAGVPVEQSRANLAMYWRYAGNQGLPRDYTQAMREFSAAQVNPEAVAQAWAGAMGVNPASPDGRGPALFGTLNWRIHNPNQPIEMLDQRTAMIAQYYGRANQSARIAGLPQTDPFSIIGTPLENNPDRMMFEGDVKDWFNQSMTSNPTFGQQVGFSVMSRAMSMIGQGNLSGATQLLQSRGTYEGIFNQLTASGNSATMSGAAALAYSDLNVDQRRLADSLLSGDRLAISRFGARTGNQRLQILDPETGLPAFEEGINASEAAMLRADDPYNLLEQVSDEQLAGGTRGMENQLRLQGRAQRYYNRGIDLWQRQVSSGFQQGNFFEAAQVFRRFGMQLNVGTGQGYWDIEDAQRGINRQQEAYNLEQGGRSINLQEAQFELAGRQFNEQWNFNRRQFNFQTTYQWNQMQRGFARQEVEWGWQREDMAFDRNKDELQYGWQMEDFDRNIRFARGRERLDLLRQRNRAVITQSMDMMQRQRTEDRFESTVDFQKEGNRLQEQYFKENKKFQEEAQDMNKRHFEERRALERQRMDMTKENHEKQKSWMTERWALEDQRVLLDRQNIELQRKITEEVAQKTAEWQDNTIALQEAMQGIGTYFSDWSVELSNIAANAPKILEILQGIKNLGSLTSGNITIQVGSQSINLSQALNNAYTIPQGPG